MVRVGWFKAVQVKSLTSHETKALLRAYPAVTHTHYM
jgi:hypothetical protein